MSNAAHEEGPPPHYGQTSSEPVALPAESAHVVCNMPPEPATASTPAPPSYQSVVTGSNTTPQPYHPTAMVQPYSVSTEPAGLGIHYADDTKDKLIEEDPEWKYSKCRCFFSILLHLGFFGCLLAAILVASVGNSESGAVPACAVLAFLCWILNLIESCCSVTFCDADEAIDKVSFKNSIEKRRANSPKLVWKVKCYHYERRDQLVTDGNSGNSQRRLETYEARIDTHVLERDFQINNWRDISSVPPDFGDAELMEVNFRKEYTFTDDSMKAFYLNQKEQFRQECKMKDTYMDFTEEFDIGEIKDSVIVKKGTFAYERFYKPRTIFMWFSAFMCTWIYRYWMYKVTRKFRYTFVKEIVD